MDGRWDARRLGRTLAWIFALGLSLGSVLFALQAFGITAEQPEPTGNFFQRSLAIFEAESDAWPQELIGRLLFTFAFLALAGLGLFFGHVLDRDDGRSTVARGTFALAGTIGVVSQLFVIGIREFGINPTFCDCGFAQEQIISQQRVVALAGRAEDWLFYGLFFLGAIGFFAIGSLARSGGWSRGWGTLAYAIAALFVVGLALQVVAFLVKSDPLFRAYDVAVLLGAGILMPAWAIWFARQLRDRGALPPEPAAQVG